VSGSAKFTSSLILKDGASGGEATLTVPTGFTSYTLTLPTTDGGVGEFLQTNGSGVLTWAAVAAGTGDFMKDGSVAATGDFKMATNAIGSTSAVNFNSDSDNAGADGGFNFKRNGSSVVTISASGAVTATAATVTGTTSIKAVTETVVAGGTCSTSYNIDPTTGTMFTLTLSGACTIGVTNLAAGQSFVVKLTQSSTTAPSFSATFKWPAAVQPTWSTTATKYDVLACASFDGSTLQCNGMIDLR
jgi:hypothetical protein